MPAKPTYHALEQRVEELEAEIARRKEEARALRQSEKQYTLSFEHAVDAIFWADPETGIITNCNRAAERLLEKPRDLIIGSYNTTLHPSEHSRRYTEMFKRHLEEGGSVDDEAEVITSSGKMKPIHITASVISIGESTVVQGIFRDISERRAAEERLRESEQKYRNLFDESRDAIYVTSKDGRFLDANRALIELFGYTRRELMEELNVRELYAHPDDRTRFQREIEKEGSVRDYEARFVKKSGALMDCLLSATLWRSGDRRVSGYQGIIRDITMQKRAQEELRERESHYRAMVDAFDGLIYKCSQDYRVEFMNERLIKRTGYDATGCLCYEALHNLQSVCPWCVNDRVFKGETVRWEVQSPADNRWYYIVNAPIHHADGSMSKQAMILDITDRKEMEEELKRSSDKIKLFAYSVSHDLKSPAVAIYGLTKRLQASYAELLDATGRSYCDQIVNAAEQIAALVEQVNLYISAKESPLSVEEVKIREVINMVRDEFAPSLSIRAITWSEPERLPEIRMDRIACLRIIRNLVDNALRYGGEKLSEIRIGYDETDDFHIISVSNNGIGIEVEASEKIFELFQRQETSRGVSGTGLGLAIVRELAEQHGGSVWVESAPKEWTCFHISIQKDL